MMPSPVCRCCLSDECFKDISNEYYHTGQREVYSEMLLDVFNINLSYQHGIERLICEDCIVKLREATAFKKLVVTTENIITGKLSHIIVSDPNQIPKDENDDYIDHVTVDFAGEDDKNRMISKNCDDTLVNDSEANKCEDSLLNDNVLNKRDGDEFCWQNDDDNYDDNKEFLLKLEAMDRETKSSHNILNGSKKPIASCTTKQTKKSLKTKLKLKNKKVLTTNVSKTRQRDKISQLRLDRKLNTLKLINNSDLCLFDSLKTKYKCFTCDVSYMNFSELRVHTKTHDGDKFHQIKYKKRLQGTCFKFADISSLTCKLCKEKIEDIDELVNHLNKKHDLELTDKHLLIPFKLESGFKCVKCCDSFNTFYRLSIHMNGHYTNHVCEVCGKSFINRVNLKGHRDAVHKPRQCTKCPAIFASNSAKQRHMTKQHNAKHSKRYCLLCDKTFRYSYMLEEHKIQDHGKKRPISACDECGKTFLTPVNLRTHVRCVHKKERNYPCEECGMRFFTSSDKRRHESHVHLDVRSFACSYCEARFKSKDSLRRHLRRQHGHLFGELQSMAPNNTKATLTRMALDNVPN